MSELVLRIWWSGSACSSLSAASTDLDPAVVTTLVLAFLVGAGLWWIYFHRWAQCSSIRRRPCPHPA